MTVRAPEVAPFRAPGGDKRRRGRLFSVLAVLLFAAAVLGGLIWALQNFGLLEGSKDRSGTKSPATTTSKVQVPDLYYASTAANDLANTGLKLGSRSDVANDAVPVGVVIESNPAEGTEVEQGTSVDITVSTGPQQAPVVQPVPAPAPPAYEKQKEEKTHKGKKKNGKKK